MRYESGHTYFNNVRGDCRTFDKCCTLSERHQLLQIHRCAGSYLSVNTDAKNTVPLDLETYSDASIRDALVTVNASAEDEVTYICMSSNYKVQHTKKECMFLLDMMMVRCCLEKYRVSKNVLYRVLEKY